MCALLLLFTGLCVYTCVYTLYVCVYVYVLLIECVRVCVCLCARVCVCSLITWQCSRCCVVVGTHRDNLLLWYAGEQN